MTKRIELLTKTEMSVLAQACQKQRAASYLFTPQLVRLERLGLIEKFNEHSYVATMKGRATWLGDGA